MVTNWEEQFRKVFPGSTTPLNFERIREVQSEATESWDDKPKILLLNGRETEFFTIGQLGKALGGRSANTLRAWEKDGILPRSPYVTRSHDPRARRRMYTRDMVETIVKIAKEEKVWFPDKGKKLSETKFKERLVEFFRSLQP